MTTTPEQLPSPGLDAMPPVQEQTVMDRIRDWRVRLAVPVAAVGLAVSVAFSPAAETAQAESAEATTESAPSIGPPFYGPAQLGHTYQSVRLRPTANSYADMIRYYGDSLYHPYPAIDFKVAVGRDLLAVTSGTIAIASEETDQTPDAWPRRPGEFVLLDPDDPRLPNFAYKHLSETDVVEGQHVSLGQVIGDSGRSQSPNAHLHFDAHTTVEGFNTYPNQADYGNMRFWQCGHQETLNTTTAIMGDRINPQPTRAASIRNCGPRITNR